MSTQRLVSVSQLKPGDVVRLRGDKKMWMTVEKTHNTGVVEAVWFAGHLLQRATFGVEALVKRI